MAREEGNGPSDSYSFIPRSELDHYGELFRIDYREKLESKPMSPDTGLRVALDKLPAAWTRGICDELGLAAGTRAEERKKAILEHLTAPGTLAEVWRDLPGLSRRMLRWLVIDNRGFAPARRLSEEFGPDDDYAWYWNKGEWPTTPLGLLRLNGLVFKGMATLEGRRMKVAVVPVELRHELSAVVGAPGAFAGAPPEPEQAFRRQSGVREVLEVEGLTGWAKTRDFENIYQFMIVLKEVSPPVWRRIQVPETYSFWDLHVAIQDAMGWLDYHLHEFNILDPRTDERVIIELDSDALDNWRETLTDYEQWISDYFCMENASCEYLYDFGDDWRHEIKLEAILSRKKGVKYPVCVAGERACPPEDCGGAWGYADFLEIIRDPSHEEHEEIVTWAGGSFDPEHFDPLKVSFWDPAKRWRIAYLDEEEDV